MSPRIERLRAVRHVPLVLRTERLEDRALLATFTVTNLLNTGTGSLRDAITGANASPGADQIAFGVAGTIALTAALPGITGPVTIAGGSAPGFTTTPRVTVNFSGRPGLRFLAGSDGSRLESLALVRSSGNAVTIDAPNVTLAGNFIGVLPDGRTAAANRGHGVLVNAGASGTRVGVETTVAYSVTPQVTAVAAGGTLPVAGWQGLTTAGTAGRYLITGTTTNPNAAGQTAGLLYVGPITAQDGAGYVMVMPDQGTATTDGTTAYAAEHLGNSRLRVVGTYSNTGLPNELGFIFDGTVADVADASKYTAMPLPTPNATWNIPHSTSGGLVVGNYDSSTVNGLPAGGGRAYVYDAVNARYLVPSLVFPGSASNTAYGIWWNGGTSYTICGGYAESPINNLLDQRQPLSKALLVDYDSTTGLFTNWTSFSYTPPSGGAAGITHFEGISGVEPGAYTLAATALVKGETVAGFVRISRNANGSFGDMQWTDLAPPVVGGAGGAFADSVYGNAVVGIDPTSGGVNAYQGTVAVGGNVIGGNGGSGVAVAGKNTVIASNMIGVTAAGTAAVANGGDGVRLLAGSSGTLVGRADPVSAVAYANAAGVTPAVTAWQGLRAAATSDSYLFAGTSGASGLLYVGPIDAIDGTSYPVNVPSAVQTSGHGPDLLDAGRVRVVGSYVNAGSSSRFGFLYEGAVGDLATAANYRTIRPASNPQFTYARSTMGGLVVGNYDSGAVNGEPVGAGKAFLYDVAADAFLPDIVFPGSVSNTAYGIWFNGGTSYTICGGYALEAVNNLAREADQNRPLGRAFLVDYDAATRTFANWKSFTAPGAADAAFVTHFQGISGVEDGVYTLAAATARAGAGGGEIGALVTVRRAADGTFGTAVPQDLAYPGAASTIVTSVSGNAVTGLATGSGGSVPFQATVTESFQLSNVIGGNAGSGIAILGATDSRVMMNAIGTSVAGTVAVPNRGQGVLVSNRAAGTQIGGQATGGNDPTGGVFVRPPQGNLISGNRGDGVRVTGQATGTTLSGNFVGTTASGNAALGNGGDGVAIVTASGTSLVGTTFRQSPFVFYNVLAGNSGNGLQITNATDTIVQANFAGVGADNATVVANGGSGILATGRSSGITAGGPIPLGNVTSGNNRHGIEIAGGTSGFVSFNNFAGMVAFGGAAPNKLDGINITATGGGNVVRTSLVGGNRGNGITIAGNARGVTVEDTAAGTNAAISASVPNGGSGILITGNARDNAIGGFQPSIETKVHLSGNGRYGLEITGRARDNRIFNAVIGAGFVGTERIPNGIGGIFVGPGTSGTVIGGAQPFMANRVLFNGGAGVTISGSAANQVIGNEIRANTAQGIALSGGQNNRIGAAGAGNSIAANGSSGIAVSGNLRNSTIQANTVTASGADGLRVQAATNLLVGGTLAGSANTITMSAGDGLLAAGDCRGTKVIGNVIADNAAGDVDVAGATGIIYVP